MKRLVAALLVSAAPAQAEFVLQLPPGAVETYGKPETTLPAEVPVGPAIDGTVKKTPAPDTIRRTVWRSGAEQSVRNVTRKIAKQLERHGYRVIFDCVVSSCGGFDFRFGIDVVPEPMMRVDLRDYRFITAVQAMSENPGYATFLISRSPDAVFIQLTEYRAGAAASELEESTEAESAAPEPPFKLVLDGLEFTSGGADIEADPNGSVAQLAQMLAADEGLTVLLVGHSDMSGSFGANMSISKARAMAVRATLINDHGIDGSRLTAHGAGFLVPRAGNDTAAGREKNRRVEAVFSR
ncbi:MAG: OmpA family protein [Rhodobacteraceae bacterium]|nr:OmpA family protein [Paracoccaceae bacterium]